MIDFINRYSSSLNGEWALGGLNCATVCRDALKAIGILPRDYGSISPFGLWATLFGRFGNPAMQQYSTTTRYGELFQSLRVDSQKGVDYGSPRFGMNTFDFIMLMLRPQRACVTVQGPNGPETTCE